MEWQRAKKDPVFASAPGNGSLSHFVGISTSIATKVPMTHVPYKDSGVGIVDLAAGRLPMLITGLQPLIEMHKAGKIKLLAVSGDVRSPLVPEVPTLKEAGVNVVSSTYTGVFGPAKCRPDLVSACTTRVTPMLSNPAMKDKLAQQA
jgi:tripartite-type tricarboxylate transporter receptor subunit TctC